ncbi:MAG TPA: ABC transporter permease [Terriglobales bacterium]|nr:ABC transporter permease [Terriglobales bacterium]
MSQPSHLGNVISREIIGVALDTFRHYKVRFTLTALGVVIGTASLILVVTIGLTGKQYVLRQIEGIGANMIWASYEIWASYDSSGAGPTEKNSPLDSLSVEDMHAVQRQVPGIAAASPMVSLRERIPTGGGKQQDVLVLGVDPQYQQIRNLEVLAGRFFDEVDVQANNKVATLTDHLARRTYGSQKAAIGTTVRIGGLPFTVIGTVKERVETFGQSELAGDTIVIPYRISRYFVPGSAVDQLFFSMANPAEVRPATAAIKRILQARHRPESVYRVENLTQLLTVAAKAANALTMVLLLVALVTLLVSGVGIMNIMLATVSARTREIGIRKAVGATAAEIKFQFLAEAVLISLIGGVIGIAVGLAVPFSVRFFTDYNIPISGISVLVAIGVSSLVGILFGTVPATRAAQMDPIASLRYE